MVFYMVFLTSKSSGNLFWGKKVNVNTRSINHRNIKALRSRLGVKKCENI